MCDSSSLGHDSAAHGPRETAAATALFEACLCVVCAIKLRIPRIFPFVPSRPWGRLSAGHGFPSYLSADGMDPIAPRKSASPLLAAPVEVQPCSPATADELMPLVYEQLRALAGSYLK